MREDGQASPITGPGSLPQAAKQEVGRLFHLKPGAIAELLTLAYDEWSLHKAPRLGASLAYYMMLSLAPALVVILAMASWAFSEQAAQGLLFWQIQDVVGPRAATALQAVLQGTQHPGSGIWATVLGLITLGLSASSAVAELRDALNTLWDVAPRETNSHWMSLLAVVRDRTFAFGLVLGGGLLLFLSLAFNAWIGFVKSRLQPIVVAPGWALEAFDSILSFVVVSMLFALLYRILPDVPLRWKDVVIGALGAGLLFHLGKYLIALYLGRATFLDAYGAAGSLVVLLIWIYYSAQIFFFGAAFSKAYANRYGSKPSQRYRRLIRQCEG